MQQFVADLPAGFCGRLPVRVLGASIPENDMALEIADQDSVIGEVQQRCLATEFVFYHLMRSDIGADADPFSDSSLVLQDRNTADGDVPALAVVAPQAVFGLIKRARSHRLGPNGCRAFTIVKVDRVDPSRTFSQRHSCECAPHGQVGDDLAVASVLHTIWAVAITSER